MKLEKISQYPGVEGPVVVIVLDGIGASQNQVGNAIHHARTPVLDRLLSQHDNLLLKAHGVAVGMPSDADMGNSEVGHNAIGAGQVYSQGAALVQDAIATGNLFEGQAWQEVVNNVRDKNSTCHFLGLFSDGNVHSHIDHLKALIVKAKEEGLKKVRIHVLLDGRDVPATSALEYVEPFEQFLREVSSNDFDAQIASGGGRMNITMDRYGADWSMVERGWKTHVLGEGRMFPNTTAAIETYREENANMDDQDLLPFVIEKGGKPLGTIEDGDSVVFFNFRGDRAIEISQAFENKDFGEFDRKRFPDVIYAGMLQYDGDEHIPARYLVSPPSIKDTLGEHLASHGLKQFAISETQKYGHVTYFWNGNRSGKFDDNLETYVEIPSDVIPFEQRPWMKAAEITDSMIEQLKSGNYDLARVNYANGDMVGHTGDFNAAIIGVETVDLALSRLLPVIDALNGVAIITADHGNADEMFEFDKKTGQPKEVSSGVYKPKTSHTLNPVPCIFYGAPYEKCWKLKQGSFGLSNLASTALNIMGYQAPDSWDESLIQSK